MVFLFHKRQGILKVGKVGGIIKTVVFFPGAEEDNPGGDCEDTGDNREDSGTFFHNKNSFRGVDERFSILIIPVLCEVYKGGV